MVTDAPPSAAEQERLAALLTWRPLRGPQEGAATGCYSPFGNPVALGLKATDIARNCGIAIRRVERITEYRISLKSGLLGKTPELTAEQLGQVAALAA